MNPISERRQKRIDLLIQEKIEAQDHVREIEEEEFNLKAKIRTIRFEQKLLELESKTGASIDVKKILLNDLKEKYMQEYERVQGKLVRALSDQLTITIKLFSIQQRHR